MIETTKLQNKKNQTTQIVSQSEEKLTDKVLISFAEAVRLSEEVSKIVQDLQESTKTQTASIGEMSQTAQSITTAIQQIGQNSQKVMDKVNQSNTVATETSREAEKGIEGMNSINDIVEKSSDSVKSLAGELVKIDKMVEVITQMAEQTNLLSLNAAIEAARAGDAGRGFAVVADEVRRLAENSRKGAEDIKQLVQNLRESSTTTTKIIQDGTTIVKQNSDLITKVLQSLRQITESIGQMATQMQEIASATEEISAGSEEAAAASEEILSVAETNKKSFEEIVQKKDQETASVTDAGTAAKTLAEIFDTLDNATIVSITDAAGNIEFMNKFFLDVAKFRNEELIGQNHRLLKTGFHTPALFDALWKTISGGQTFIGYVRNKSKDGSIYWVKTCISPTFDENRKIKGYVGVRTPITELMVLTGIEDAIRDEAKGKKLNKKMADMVEALRTGNYKVQNNYS
jgi:PAS domain S-box-containing protein